MPEAIRGSGAIEIRRGTTSLDITPYVPTFVWTESLLAGGWTWEMEFDTEDWKDWHALIIGRDENPGREFRLVSQVEGQEVTTPWLTALVDGSVSAVKGRTLSARVRGADRRLDIQQFERTRAWPASSVADIVRRVAAEFDLTPDVEDTLGSRDRWQIRTDTWSYIHRLSQKAASRSRRGDVYLWIDGGALRLRAPDVGGASAVRHDLDEVENRVDKTVVTNHGRAVDRRGGATMLGVSYDVLAGTPVRFVMGAEAAVTQPALASRLARPATGGRRVATILSQTSDLVEADTRGQWGSLAPRYFTLRLESRPDLTLRPGSIIELQANLNERQNLPVFGRYVVLEVQHVLDGGDIRTTAACFRREAFAGDEEPTGASVSSGPTRDRVRAGGSRRPRGILVAEVLPQ